MEEEGCDLIHPRRSLATVLKANPTTRLLPRLPEKASGKKIIRAQRRCVDLVAAAQTREATIGQHRDNPPRYPAATRKCTSDLFINQNLKWSLVRHRAYVG